jgi:tetratricopeptide (TPR) repeat protein
MDANGVDFFTAELQAYFTGTNIPTGLYALLSRPLASLNAQDTAAYNQLVGPYLDRIRAALAARFVQQGSPREDWAARLSPYRRSIAEELASQVLGMSNLNTLPAARAIPFEIGGAAQPVGRPGRRLSFPAFSLRSMLIAAAVVLLLVVACGGVLYYYQATAPSRALDRAGAALERGEYEAAYHLYQEVQTRYPDKEEAAEAEVQQEGAAFSYAEALKSQSAFGEALQYYDLATAHDVQRSIADCHLGWAKQYEAAGDYENAFNQCEDTLRNAPQDYDRASVMDLRAEALYLWGDRYMQQGNYSAASSRFNKSLSEWPDGRLAQAAGTNYVDCTVASHSMLPPPSKEASAGGRVELRIRNDSDIYTRFFFSGPSSLYVDLPASSSTTAYVTPGVYDTLLMALEENVKPYYTQDDLSEPTTSYSWWEVTIPPMERLPVGSGTTMEAIGARLNELKATLPPAVVECMEGIELKADYAGEDAGREGYFDASERAIYVNPAKVGPEGIDAIIMHEWGHAFAWHELDSKERNAYKKLRGILPDTLWENHEKSQDSVEEDFAEVFAVVFDANVLWVGYTVYGPVANPEQLRQYFLDTAANH